MMKRNNSPPSKIRLGVKGAFFLTSARKKGGSLSCQWEHKYLISPPRLYSGLPLALDDARSDRMAGETGGVMDVELLHELRAVFFDGLDADG